MRLSSTVAELNGSLAEASTRQSPTTEADLLKGELPSRDGNTAINRDGNRNSIATRDVDIAALVDTAKRRGARGAPTETSPAYYIEGLEKWEGRIEAIYRRDFSARLVRVLGDETEEYEAEFETRLVADDDADLFAVGADFYLTVRTTRTSRGTYSRTARISLRRTGRWTVEELAEVRADATRLANELKDVF